MNKKLVVLFSIFIIAALVLTGCAGDDAASDDSGGDDVVEAGAPAECADNADEKVCAVFEPGDTIKVGFVGPMAGDLTCPHKTGPKEMIGLEMNGGMNNGKTQRIFTRTDNQEASRS
mgnify:CR=1 FL=1